MKNVKLPSGEVIGFPDTMDDSSVNSAISQYMVQKAGAGYSNQSPVNTFNVQRPPAPQTNIGSPTGSDFLRGGMEFGRDLLPVAGSFFGPEGTLAGSFARQALSPDTNSVGDVVGGTAKDLTFNELLPGLIKGLAKIPGSFKTAEAARIGQNAENLKDIVGTSPSIPEYPSSTTSETIPGKLIPGKPRIPGTQGVPPTQAFPSNISLGEKSTLQERLNNARANQYLSATGKATSEIPGSPGIAPTIGIPPEPPRYLPDTRLDYENIAFENPARNQELQGQKELTNLVNKGFSPSTKAIDPPKILDELDKNPDSYANIDPMKRESLKTFLQGVQDQKSLSPELTKDSLMKYVKHRLTFEIAGVAAGAAEGHALLAGSLILGGEAVTKLVQNPEIAKVAARAFTTGATSPESGIVSKILLYALKGSPAVIKLANGKEEKVQIDSQGNITYPQPK